MKIQNTEYRTQNTAKQMMVRVLASVIFALVFTVHSLLFTAAYAADWGGVDESVVEKYAKEHGREAHEPLINTDQGDLLLFVFLLAGTVGGFIGGYYWRTLTENRTEKSGAPGHRANTD